MFPDLSRQVLRPVDEVEHGFLGFPPCLVDVVLERCGKFRASIVLEPLVEDGEKLEAVGFL
eukprot:12002235-Prorocentrum_lima.AAC.1